MISLISFSFILSETVRMDTLFAEEAQYQKWNRRRLNVALSTEGAAVAWAINAGLLPATKSCFRCHKEMYLKTGGRVGRLGAFICKNRHCPQRDKDVARARGSWFSHSHLSVQQVMSLTYSFARVESYHTAIFESASDEFLNGLTTACIARQTICDWYSFCREIVVDSFIGQSEDKPKIGGPGIIVQIDESKFGSRKFHRGRRVLGHWVLGIIADGSTDLRLELCPVTDDRPEGARSAEDLIPLILKHVAVGSEIHTDAWKAYGSLHHHGYIHRIVNHSDPNNRFVAADGTHTQRIESHWRPVKDYFRGRRVPHDCFADALVEYGWRRHCKKNNVDTFDSLLNIIKTTYSV